MSELATWLREQLDEDGRIAQAACWDEQSDVWTARPPQASYERYCIVDYCGDGVVAVTPENADDDGVGQHVAEHDPARVLREIDAKRQLLDEFAPEPSAPEADEQLHARCAHPAYEYRTTEGPRKQWDDVDVPPANDDGTDAAWERNVAAGRDGWERWDYTEESYWRRRLPAGQERQPDVPLPLKLLALPYQHRPGYREEWAP
ncbi:DUF6221 family protein [Streptomyces cadmiisoli]|uniref:DUF6221 family protein n=1 Tax=Streptomyces cadmiisoli TaxID=2184053 RepID=UPI003D753B2F